MRRISHQLILTFSLTILILTSCIGSKNQAVSVIENYIQALSNRDAAQISNLSCADWEQSALLEVDSLTAVGSEVVDMTCKETGQEGNDWYVSCSGVIALDYNGEIQQIDLSDRTYIARQEGSDWFMCGYK